VVVGDVDGLVAGTDDDVERIVLETMNHTSRVGVFDIGERSVRLSPAPRTMEGQDDDGNEDANS
jgi:hypothetical protein